MSKRMMFCSIVIILSMLLAPRGAVMAQDQQPPQPVEPRGGSNGPYSHFQGLMPEAPKAGAVGAEATPEPGLLQDKDGLWYQVGSPEANSVFAEADISAEAVADTFGYTYSSVKLNWIDATGGTKLEDLGDYSMQYVELPFDFTFYNQTVGEMYVSKYGYLQVGDYSWTDTQSPLLRPNEPNQVIAPFWAPLHNHNYGDSGVYMLAGQDVTGRYVVFEWNAVSDNYFNTYTFEAVLYEDGRIIFQHNENYYDGYGWYCGAAGIEDWTGTVGKATMKYCSFPRSYRAIQFAPPRAPAARVQIYPVDYGAFGVPGTEAEVIFMLHNTGNLGNDVYDFTVKSRWPVTLYGEDEFGDLYALIDSDGDKKVDTGSIPNGAEMQIHAKTMIPVATLPGKTLSGTITAASSLKPARKATIYIQTTVPAGFTQTYRSDPGNQTAYISPTAGWINTETQMDDWEGSTPAVTTLSNGNTVSLWYDYFCDEMGCPYEELYYRVNNSQGAFVAGNAKLQDLTGQNDVWDFNGTLAAAPDGSTGITWVHEFYNETVNGYQYNIYFAILNASGAISYGPVNITQYSGYFSYNDYTGKLFYNPQIAATADNRFVLAWYQYEYVDGFGQDDIYTAILGTAGQVIQGIAKRTNDQGDVNGNGWDDSSNVEPSVTPLTNNRFLLSWSGWERKKYTSSYKLYYQVFDSLGNSVNTLTTISTGTSIFSLDGAQMSNGQIILAWSRYNNNSMSRKPYVYYMVLKDATYKRAKGPTALNPKAAATGSGYVSVTNDNQDHAILTWVDYEESFGKHLYYSLLGKNGAILTKPVIALSNYDRWQDSITVNNSGYGNSPYPVVVPQ